jgi:hypothetical protein
MSGKGPDPSIWLYRLTSILRRIDSFSKRDLLVREVRGRYGEYSKKLVEKIFAAIQTSGYVRGLLESTGPVDNSWIVETNGVIARLDALLNHVSSLMVQVGQIPRDLPNFIDELYLRFTKRPVPYLLAIPFVKGTPFTQSFMNRAIRPNIAIIPEARLFEEKALQVIYVSPEIAVPANWSLLIHEAAHILEDIEFGVHRKFYVEDTVGSAEAKEANWALEIACDAIATYSCGPIFGQRLLQNYHNLETKESDTHPPTKMRLAIIAEQLREIGWNEEAKQIEDRINELRLPTLLEKAPRPQFTGKILVELLHLIEKKKLLYKSSQDRKDTIAKIADRLREFKPCVEVDNADAELLDLLNASHYVDLEMSGTSDGNENGKYAAFQNFLGDMIRLDLVARQQQGLA